jgi:hypothetical protein
MGVSTAGVAAGTGAADAGIDIPRADSKTAADARDLIMVVVAPFSILRRDPDIETSLRRVSVADA